MHVGATQGCVIKRLRWRQGALLRSNHRICTVGTFLNMFTVLCMMCAMGNPYDCQCEAQTAMSMALAATGNDRQNWIRVALSWQYLARNAADRGRASGSVQERPLALPA